MCEEFDNLWTNTAINEYLKETRNEILSKKEEITRTIYKKLKKNFAKVKKVSEILERTHVMKNHWTKYRRASQLSNSAQVRKHFE